MKECRKYCGVLKTIIWLGISILTLLPQNVRAAIEETFPTLQIGTRVYKNVTVTTKAKNYVFILHSSGMENIKVGDLPEDIRLKLGYVPDASRSQKTSNWARDRMADFHIGDVKATELNAQKKWHEQSAIVFERVRALDHKLCGAILGGLLLLHLCFCFCCMLICQKAGKEPGILIWLPLLQIFPLLRAAGMSAFWAIAYLLVVPGIIAQIIWCFKIASARGKSPLVGFSLLLPVISFFAFLYLAFSESAAAEPAPKEDKRGSRLMTLETA